MDTPYYYYTVLDVPHDATLADVKKAYRKKALQYHPDKCRDPAAADKFKEVNQAFHVLSDLEKRRCYDNFGGLERPEIPVTINRPFEDFCEGVAIGTFTVFANIAIMLIFGVPSGFSIPGWMLFGQMLTAWEMLPASLEQASEIKNWTKCIGAITSPLFLAASASCVAGCALFNGGKLAIEYSKDKLGELGTSISTIGVQINKTLKASKSMRRKSKNTEDLSLDDWFVMDKDSKTKRESPQKKDVPIPDQAPAPAAATVPTPSKPRPKPSTNHNPDDDWVLLDDF